MFVCMASHKSAEPNTPVVMLDFAEREALLEEAPETYYLKEHDLTYPCVLVRLSSASADALEDLVRSAHRFLAGLARKGRRAGASFATSDRSRTH